MTTILITGASGLLGRAVSRSLQTDKRFNVAGQAFSRLSPGLLQADLTQERQVDSLFERSAPEVVVHCAAERRPDVSEKDPVATLALNEQASRAIAERCAARNAFLIYLSTDYVFDGQNPPYAPGDRPNPLNRYGESKLAGELRVQEALPYAVILRVPVLYGPCERLDESAVTAVATSLLSSAPQTLDHWAVRYPTYTEDVAAAISQLIDRQLSKGDVRGIFHFSGTEAFTKYEMAVAMADAWGVSADHIRPDASMPAGAPRPRDCRLDCTTLNELGIDGRSSFRRAIAQVIRPFKT